jgi:hypothetical protein
MAAMPAAATQLMGTMAFKAGIISGLGARGSGLGARDSGLGAQASGFDAGGHARLLHLIQHPLNGWSHRIQEDVGKDTHQDRHRDHRHDDEPLARAEIDEARVFLVGHRPVVDPLEHPQHVRRREDDAGCREGGHPRIPLERAEQNQELADEPVESRQPDRRERDDEKRGDQMRHHVLQPAVLGDEPRVAPIRQHADDQEERARADAVGDHLVDGPLRALHVHGRDAQDDEPEMADARVRHELLHVGLHHRDERAVDDADHGQRREQRREVHGRCREQRERKPQQPVRPHLQQHAGQDHGAGGRRLHVRVGQPCVERKQRDLDRERQREGEKQPELRLARYRELVELQEIERVLAGRDVVQVRQPEDRQQHQDAAGHRIEQELDGRVNAAVVAPDADEEIHRHQHRVPEHIEQEQIERDEHADHRALEQQDEDRKRPRSLVDRLPRTEERDRGQEAREHDEQQADAVHADEVADAECRNPRVPLHELELGGGRVEVVPEQERLGEHQRGHDERDRPDGPFAPLVVPHEEQEGGADDGKRDERRENRKMHQRQRKYPRIRTAPRNSDVAYVRTEPV